MPRVAYQGIPGANSEIAVRQHFGEDVDAIPCQDFIHLFAALQAHEVDFSLLPVENALAGSVSGAYELLLDHDVRIQAEVILHVHHALLANPDTSLENVTTVRSHPQALLQCQRFLQRHNIETVGWYDTAGAAKDLSESPRPGVAVIAPRLAGELYGLELLAADIEDERFNYTRLSLDGTWRSGAFRLQQNVYCLCHSSPAGSTLRMPGRICQARLESDQAGIPSAAQSPLGAAILS